ncbi:hypothetical protein AVEN_212086-1 [Araneus ventricosus]|uniref:Uncharacterized protein n=1 Tax=Araneus ventricosus TaxID=182803 RepID=A0A4Y2BJY0_ARAVE|nr:hypothetical protein AVEN_212086-1 [Araneus ventricosus]
MWTYPAEVSEELGIVQSVISSFGNDSKMMPGVESIALWTPQQWSCVDVFSDESRFSLRLILSGLSHTESAKYRYHQENTIERRTPGYGGAGWLVWEGIILGSRTDLHVQSVTMAGHIYRDAQLLEQHGHILGAMGARLLFMDDKRPSSLQTL